MKTVKYYLSRVKCPCLVICHQKWLPVAFKLVLIVTT